MTVKLTGSTVLGTIHHSFPIHSLLDDASLYYPYNGKLVLLVEEAALSTFTSISPGSEADSFDFPIVDASTSVLTRAQKKNMRKKQKKKKELKQKDYAFEIEEVLGPLEELKVSPESISTPLAEKTSDVLKTDHSVEATKKKLRTLKKKLKQIEELEEKLCLGELNPNKEQLNKIARKEEFVEEIEALTTSL